MTLPATALQLRSLVTPAGVLELSLVQAAVPVPGPDEVLIQVEAAPINPSDIGLLFGAADLATAWASGSADTPALSARIPERAMAAMAARLGQSLATGNEGAGLVVAAGSSAAAQALLGARVAALGGGMYARYRALPAGQCLRLPEGATAAEGASCFVNPLTALGMVDTMRLEGHKALVHTAAASNLGQMLNRICLSEGVALVNIVRKPEQEALLRGQGAQYVCNMDAPGFQAELTDALAATGATIAFDATGGGKLGGQILGCMEAAINRSAKEYNRYGSTVHKQVYLYGGLNTAPTEFNRNFGMCWGMGGFLLWPFLNRVGPARANELKARVAAELKTTFASHYAKQISLAEVLSLDALALYGPRNTGAKVLVNPSLG